ncbi:MAG TPA: hypothetical protein VGQ83_05265 [Polyangia bacterium]|jgi:hypothetical protein
MRRLLVVALTLVAAACGESTVACRVAADCASGRCGADGRCLPPAADAGADAAPPDGAGPADAGAEGGAPTDGAAPADGADGAPIVCSPNHDGVIERAEVPLAAGLHATFRVAAGVDVNTAGTAITGGRRWELGGALTGDHAVLLELRPLTGLWFADTAAFAGATYVARMSDTNDLLGVFKITPDALLMLGVASPASSLTETLLAYDPPVTVLQFPLQVGATWSTDSTVTGHAAGVYGLYYFERYASQVDTAGELVAPYGTFDVLRAATLMTRTMGLLVTTSRSFAFVSECFGTVGTIRSDDNESAAEFTHAAEVWRMAP